LLVSEHTGGCLRVSDSEKQWNIGPETALRQIAGLIAYGLVERMPSSMASAAGAVPSVPLTEQGRRALRNALDLS
jgi:DNA-binding MarR family transcriptional regulator